MCFIRVSWTWKPDCTEATAHFTCAECDLSKDVTASGDQITDVIVEAQTNEHKFTASAKTLTFDCEEKNVETVTSGKYQIARIRGIKAKELKKTFTLTVKDGEEIIGTITYSPMTYCSNVLSDGTQSEALQNVYKALYLYAKAADSYFPD